MSDHPDAASDTTALPGPDAPEANAASGPEGRVSELRSTASMMRLDPGLYCVLVAPSPAADAQTGLPGVRITPAPGPAGRPEAVEVRTIAADGWMSGFGDAALVRVVGVPAYVMVTIYQDTVTTGEGAPNLQILPLLTGQTGAPRQAALAGPAGMPLPPPGITPPRVPLDVIAHIQTRGDVGAVLGDWLGNPGSGKWIEGFAISPHNGVDPADIEYQAVLGRGWLSPWVEGGQFCGSRGMALPILGLRVRLRGPAADAFELRYSASFVDGTRIGPVAAGEACEAESLAAVEAILIELAPLGSLPAPAQS
jgi:hypothetical protein